MWRLEGQVKHGGSTGNNPQRNALGETLGDVIFIPATTRLGSRQGDTDSTTDLALVSPRIAPWLSAETLTPHGSDHLPVIFSLQKPANKQNSKQHNPFRYERSGSDIVSKLRKRKPSQSTNGSWKGKKQPPWWDSEAEKTWTEKCGREKLAERKNSTQPRPEGVMLLAVLLRKIKLYLGDSYNIQPKQLGGKEAYTTASHNAEHRWEAHGTHCDRKLARGFEDRDILPANQAVRPGKCTWEKCSSICI